MRVYILPHEIGTRFAERKFNSDNFSDPKTHFTEGVYGNNLDSVSVIALSFFIINTSQKVP